MDQASIASPEVTSGPGYGVTFTTYLHSISWVLRKAISLRTGTGNLFDKTLLVSTPNLGEGHVRISICVPKTHNNDSAPKKMVLVAEGGGFVLGQPTDGEHIDRQLSDRAGLVIVSVDYAKSPRYPYPHALLQLYEVLRWSLSPEAAESLGVTIDPAHVAIMGYSAGGNLAAALTLLLSFTSGPCAAFRQRLPANFCQTAQVLLYPVMASNIPYLTRYNAGSPKIQAVSLPVWVMSSMEASYLPPHVDKNQIFIAPLATDVKLLQSLRLPSTLSITAGKDCLKFEAHDYTKKLKQAGVNVMEHEYSEAPHAFSHSVNDHTLDVADCWQKVIDFLD